MPVTVRLSQKFSERFGEDIADELVNWFNQVDAAYRSELKEVNEINFARFDAKLEQRIAEVKAELRTEFAGLRTEFAELRTEFAELRTEFTGLRTEFTGIGGEFTGLRGEFAVLRAEFIGHQSETRAALESVKAELIKWMFLFWLGTVGTVLAMARFLL